MSLVDRLALVPDFGRRRLRTEALDQAIHGIEEAFPGIHGRNPESIDEVIARLERAAELGDWAGITAGDVAVGLYEHFLGRRILIPHLHSFLDAEMRVTTRPQFVEAVAEAYLAGWAAGSPQTQAARALIVARARYLPKRWAHLFRTCPEFLDVREGPAQVGKRMAEQRAPYAWLTSIGLLAPHGTGFMEAAHNAFLRAVPAPRSKETVEKLLGWAAPLQAPALDDRRAAQVVDRIVAPWIKETCPEPLRVYCTRRIVDQFGDPRRERQEFWGHVLPETERTVLRWLARSSMEAIFEIVTEAERYTGNSRQWSERRRFWTAIYDEGRIDEAWVALGADAVPVAKKLYQQTQDRAYTSYDLQTTRNDTCLLFIKIGDKVFVEGSHNFRIHAFPTPTRKTPEFYVGPYNLDQILLPMPHDDARMHVGAWRDWVRRRIRR